jgi:D-tyrosyl-tRNA(Tyr) deacylase
VRAVVQRVSEARVEVDGEVVGRIGRGLLVLLGVGRDDDEAAARALATRIVQLRVFDDDAGRMNLALGDVGGAMLVVSQFTLWGDTNAGRRPSWSRAARAGGAALPGVRRARARARRRDRRGALRRAHDGPARERRPGDLAVRRRRLSGHGRRAGAPRARGRACKRVDVPGGRCRTSRVGLSPRVGEVLP